MKIYKLEQVCFVNKGKVAITKAVEGGFPLVTTAESRVTHNEWHFDKASVMVPLVSSTGHGHASIKRLHYEEGKFAVGNILAVLTPKDHNLLSAKFLYAYLTYFKEQKLVSLMKGSANVSLTLAKLKGIEINVPTMEEQTKIEQLVDIFSELDVEMEEYRKGVDDLFSSLLQNFLNSK